LNCRTEAGLKIVAVGGRLEGAKEEVFFSEIIQREWKTCDFLMDEVSVLDLKCSFFFGLNDLRWALGTSAYE
jgi:hypothetical protein